MNDKICSAQCDLLTNVVFSFICAMCFQTKYFENNEILEKGIIYSGFYASKVIKIGFTELFCLLTEIAHSLSGLTVWNSLPDYLSY